MPHGTVWHAKRKSSVFWDLDGGGQRMSGLGRVRRVVGSWVGSGYASCVDSADYTEHPDYAHGADVAKRANFANLPEFAHGADLTWHAADFAELATNLTRHAAGDGANLEHTRLWA
jgi:hypothetical protein